MKILGENEKFGPKSQFWPKMKILVKNEKFGQKMKILVKMENFGGK